MADFISTTTAGEDHDDGSGDIVMKTIRDVIEGTLEDEDPRTDSDDPFYICNLDQVVKKHNQWLKELPGVQPFYAVKCFPDQRIIETLVRRGAGFDCASKTEIRQVLGLGVSPDRIIYANPCKAISHLQFAKERGVSLMTFDNASELRKVKDVYPEAKLVLRIWAEDPAAYCRLSVKFGCRFHGVPSLFRLARELGLNVCGISFHVGSGSGNPETYYETLRDARAAVDIGISHGFDLQLIDVGGGFPGVDTDTLGFEKFAAALRRGFSDFFPRGERSMRLIAEPGTYYATSTTTLVMRIIGKRDLSLNPQRYSSGHIEEVIKGDASQIQTAYYVNTGIYTTVKDATGERHTPLYPSIVWGHSTSGIDCVNKRCLLPDLQEGDWLFIRDIGAYSSSLSCIDFSGFEKPTCVYCGKANEESVNMIKP
ncbi:ornithine decarboxylase-like [Diadema antillarum]|uniref:ornithine decarboxylase-like n=1 Tax=Diadema antillarum TaxID=105358 RepID=UPI003A889A35